MSDSNKFLDIEGVETLWAKTQPKLPQNTGSSTHRMWVAAPKGYTVGGKDTPYYLKSISGYSGSGKGSSNGDVGIVTTGNRASKVAEGLISESDKAYTNYVGKDEPTAFSIACRDEYGRLVVEDGIKDFHAVNKRQLENAISSIEQEIVQLEDSVTSTSTTTAATPNSVKAAYDLANSKVDSLSDLGITATATELNYIDGVTSNVQAQLNTKSYLEPCYTISAGDDSTHYYKLITITPTSESYLDMYYEFDVVARSNKYTKIRIFVITTNTNKYISQVYVTYDGSLGTKFTAYKFRDTTNLVDRIEIWCKIGSWDTLKFYPKTYTKLSNMSLTWNNTEASALPTNATETISVDKQAWIGNAASATQDGDGNVITSTYVKYSASQSLTDAQKSTARANIGAGTSSFSGSYDDLSSKPPINDAILTLNVGGQTVSGNNTFTANDSTNTTYNVPSATASNYGVVKVSSVNSSAVTVNSESTTAGRYYPVELNSDGKAIVNVPWTDNHNSHAIISGVKADGSTQIKGSASSGDITLGDSGVTAGEYGPTANATPGYGSTFNVPDIKVNSKGIVTSITNRTVKIPASDNSETTLTIEDKTQVDTTDLIYAVTNLVESDPKGHTITPAYTGLPTKTYVDNLADTKLPKDVTPLGSMGGKTITDLRNALTEWLRTYHDNPNARAKFSAADSWINYWNTNSNSAIPDGYTWTVELESTYAAADYALLKVTRYGDKHVYYIAKASGVWNLARKVAFTTDNVASADTATKWNGYSISVVNSKPSTFTDGTIYFVLE